MKTALVAGATGLVGNSLLHQLLEDGRYTQVKAISRKPLEIEHQKLEVILVDFDRLPTYSNSLAADDVFCCLGTTMKKAKTKEAFRKVDFDYPLSLASTCKSVGAKQFLLVSALGANKNSSIFYNQVKGEVEEAIANVNYDTLHIFRPSLLLGPREEERAGEDAAKFVYRVFGFLIPKKYKGIQASQVAKSMLVLAKSERKGTFIHESAELQSY